MSNKPKTQPVDRIRLAHITAAIWGHTSTNGKRFYKYTLESTYQVDGKLKSTKSFSLGDAELTEIVSQRAEDRIRQLMNADSNVAPTNESAAEA